MIVRVRKKSQITLPAAAVRQLNLKEGDSLHCQIADDSQIILTLVSVPASKLSDPEKKKRHLPARYHPGWAKRAARHLLLWQPEDLFQPCPTPPFQPEGRRTAGPPGLPERGGRLKSTARPDIVARRRSPKSPGQPI